MTFSFVAINDLRVYLEQQDKNTLVQLILEQVKDDAVWHDRLLMMAASNRPQGPDLTVFLRAIDNAVYANNVISYDPDKTYRYRVDAAIKSIAQLLSEGHAHHVMELTEYALEAVEKAGKSIEHCQSCAADISIHLQALHHEACKQALPDPEYIARRLIEWELKQGYSHLDKALITYADILGSEGIAIYRQLVESEWENLEKSESEAANFEYKRECIARMRQNLALHYGDVEAIVAVKSQDLSSAENYLEIAKLYQDAGQSDKALEWAERSIQAFPGQINAQTIEFLAEVYHFSDRAEEAIALLWSEFENAVEEGIFEPAYQRLKTLSLRISQWPILREKARDRLRLEDRSIFVKILLWEEEIELAWKEALLGEVSPDILMQVVHKWEQKHPEEVLPIYQHQIEFLINHKTNEAYTEAVLLLDKLRDIMVKLEKKAEFVEYIEKIRQTHKTKRNFTKLLSQQPWNGG